MAQMVLERFVLGLDLDGTCADFYRRMREIAAEWTGRDIATLSEAPDWNMSNWGLVEGEYSRLHRFAVTERQLFETMEPLPGAPQALRRLATEGVRIRIITHRLFIQHFHETAVAQTIRWLEHNGIPYWDLCFMRDKGAVGADLYVEDSPENIAALHALRKRVLIYSNATNAKVRSTPEERFNSWDEAEARIREQYYAFLTAHKLSLPSGPGKEPDWA